MLSEYNNNSALKIPYRPCSGCAMLCLLGKKLTLRKGIESQPFTEFGSSSRFFSISYGSMTITTMGGAY